MSSVKVAVRVRPFNQREIGLQSKPIIYMIGNKTTIKNPKVSVNGENEVKEFTFDYSYWSISKDADNYASQNVIFKDLGEDIVLDAFEGYNSCIFAYGQTGSGKTHTMMGNANSEGIIPRICLRLFEKLNSLHSDKNSVSYKTEISYLEIYNEQVRDLLSDNTQDINGNFRKSLKVREHPKYGPYVENLSKHLVYNYSDIYKLMQLGNTNRTTASTNMNDTSSRSHAIFIISFSKASYIANNPYETVSKINLVDLAGSERANSTQAKGQRLIEGSHINKSLVTLGSVISSLAESNKMTKKPVFIPYRDSILTWLLKDSLGGNSKTIMIATISPADVNFNETINTLRYANRAKNILNKPHINEDPNTKLIRQLRSEIEKLKSKINQNPLVYEQVQENEAKVKELTEEWICKWDEAKKILTEQDSIGIRKSGDFGVVLDSDRPHLIVCVDDDVLSTGVTLYQLNEGKTSIGTKSSNSKQDIVISNGVDVEDEHCYIDWNVEDNVVTLYPINKSLCFVNNSQVDSPTTLHQGSFIVLGENMFRFSNPLEVKNLKEKSQDSSAVDTSILASSSHLISSTSYDSVYNSISSLNKKALVSSFTSSAGLNDQSNEYETEINSHLTGSNEENNQTINSSVQINPKIDKINDELEFIKTFLQEFKQILNKEENCNNVYENITDAVLNILVKVGQEEQISKQSILQILTLINQSQIKNANCSNEESIQKVGEYLFDKLDCLKLNLRNEMKSDMINNNDNNNDVQNLNKTSIQNSDTSITNHFEQTENNQAFAHQNGSNLLDFSNDKIVRMETDIDAQLAQLKGYMSKLNLSPQNGYITENNQNCNTNSISPCLPSNILDELIQVEVERRMEIHLQHCKLCIRANNSTSSSDDGHFCSTPKYSHCLAYCSNGIDNNFAKFANDSIKRLDFESNWEELDQIIISIPAFHTQFLPDQHYVYEIKISINGDKWTIYRRYRCFLQLHKYIKLKYGNKLQLPFFPPKIWFNKCEKVIEHRRRFLENYLQKVIDLCKQLPECPLNYHLNGLDHLERQCLYNFCNFFELNTLVDQENS